MFPPGDLYSVKIMWPRSAEERARQRLTGFVCFYDREHAEACFNALSDADAFGNGRRLMLSWGKMYSLIMLVGSGQRDVEVIVPTAMTITTGDISRTRMNKKLLLC